MRGFTRSATAVLITCTLAHAAIDGWALVVADGDIQKVDVASNTWEPVVTKEDFASYHGLGGPCFSPNGERIAYSRYQLNTGDQDGTHILIADNDGGAITEICMVARSGGTFDGGVGNVECSWADNGYIYWSEDDDNIYRASVLTKTREHVAALADFDGEVPTRIDNLKVSLDGTRGASMKNGSSEGSYGYDLTQMAAKRFGSGCQGTISPNGQLVTRNTTGSLGYSYHQVAFIHDFDSKDVVDTIVAPGAQPGGSGSLPRFVWHRFSHSSDDHVTFAGEDALSGKGYVHCLSTNETHLIGDCKPFDFWNGTLPAPPATSPLIALDTTALGLESVDGAVPAAQTVVVSNAGAGTLTAVTVLNVPSWLEVTGSGDGNSQTLTNTVDPTGLTPGIHAATITVSDGGASNSVNYEVTLNVATTLLAPSALSATPGSSTSASLTWTDNSPNEDGFAIERAVESAAWTHHASVGAGTTSYVDSNLQSETMYHYRVRACAGIDSSGWSNEDSLELAVVRTITIASPQEGDSWAVGDSVHIRWSTEGVTQVDLFYSIDAGEHLLLIAPNSVRSDMPEWGDYVWAVPDLDADSLLISVQEYSNPSVADWSPLIPLEPSAAERVPGLSPEAFAGLHSARRLTDGGIAVTYGLRSSGRVRFDVYALDGGLIASAQHEGCGGRQRTVIPITARIASGMCIVRMTADGGYEHTQAATGPR